MEENFVIFGYSFPLWIVIPVAYLIWVTGLLFIKGIVFQALRRIAKNTATQLDDVLIKSLDVPLYLLIFTSGGGIVDKLLPANGELTTYFLIGFKAVTILAIVMFVDRFLQGTIKLYTPKIDLLRSTGGITRGVVRIIVIGLGMLILLDSFGVSITPVIASLGIGSLAVALALQPTLENFFAGIQLIVDKPIKVGHFVKLESGEEGYIHHVGWRSTWLRMLPNNVVVIPNSVLINSRITNYYYPEAEMAALVQVGVHYGEDLERVEKIVIEVAREIQQTVKGAVKTFEPFIRYHTFADFSINFSVILRVSEFTDQYLVKHEFMKALHRRFAKEDITIPFPIEAVNFDQEMKFSKAGAPEYAKYIRKELEK